ncbi:hypothetical protein CDCA_CDCA03G1022 [Cyanidium caldarium]|uniref:Photolyase/cryptochrome alpha/beta domain-containing protein n=1 Tax=Cyanidium caldarium TaxID=2771 RepID=A0AAV9IRX0_CYACA|nr:hypothetical protein CDCA_CDCA03G1022 [Cyanidium caldarium]
MHRFAFVTSGLSGVPLLPAPEVVPSTSTTTARPVRQSRERRQAARARQAFGLSSAAHMMTLVRPPRVEGWTAAFRLAAAAADVSSRLRAQELPQALWRGYGEGPAAGAAGKGTVLLWHRSDLRLDDNPALAAAVAEGNAVLPVYCFDPRQFGKTSFGFEKTGRYRAKFLIESVEDLRRSLRNKGSDLLVRTGKPEQVIPELCRKHNIRHVFFHQEVTYEELECEEALADALEDMGVEVRTFWTNTLYAVDDLPFAVEDTPDVYTEYRMAVERQSKVRDPMPEPDTLKVMPHRVDYGSIPTLQDLGLGEVPTANGGGREVGCVTPSAQTFTGGESEAHKRLAQYVQDAKAAVNGSSDTASGDLERTSAHLGADFSCKISPWLALGCISPRRIFAEIKNHALNGSEGVHKSTTFFELVWRDFFRLITHKYSTSRLHKSHRKVQELHTTAYATAMSGA